jgi:hypothetical protein
MPTYTITAPNGLTYSITGPAGASQQDVINQVLAQHPDAGTPRQKNFVEQIPLVGGLVNYAVDPGLTAGSALAGAVGSSLTGLFGANNTASNLANEAASGLSSLRSSTARANADRQAAILQQGAKQGVLGGITSAARAATIDPLDTAANVIGELLPYAAAEVFTEGAATPVVMGALGATSGAGDIKSRIYDATKEEFLKHGASKEDAEAAAQKAQAYGGSNTGMIALGGVIGGVAANMGLAKGVSEAIASRVATRALTDEAAESFGRAAIKGAAEAGGLGALQAGQARVAQNIALQNAGSNTPTFEGVAQEATSAAIPGAILGGALGGFGRNRGVEPAGEAGEAGKKPSTPPTPPSDNAATERAFNQQVEAFMRDSAERGEPIDLHTAMKTVGRSFVEPTESVEPTREQAAPLVDEHARLTSLLQDPQAMGAFAKQIGDTPETATSFVRNRLQDISNALGVDTPEMVQIANQLEKLKTQRDNARQALNDPEYMADQVASGAHPDDVAAGLNKYIDNINTEIEKLNPPVEDTNAPQLKYMAGRRAKDTLTPSLFGEEEAPKVEQGQLDKREQFEQAKLETSREERVAAQEEAAQQATKKGQERAEQLEQQTRDTLDKLESKLRAEHPDNSNYQIVYNKDQTFPFKLMGSDGVLRFESRNLDDFQNRIYEGMKPDAEEPLTPYIETPSGGRVEKTPSPYNEEIQQLTSDIDEHVGTNITPNERAELLGMLKSDAAITGNRKGTYKGLEQKYREAESALRNAKSEADRKAAQAELVEAANNLRSATRSRITDPIRARLQEIIENRQDEQFGAKQRGEAAKVQERLGQMEGAGTAAEEREQREAAIDLRESIPQKYRAGEKEAGGIKADEAQKVVADITKGWRSDAKVNVVQSVADLPPDVQRAIERDGQQDALGIITPDGTVHLTADNMHSLEDAKAALFHETLGHLGLEKLFRDNLDNALEAMYRGNKKLREDTDAWREQNSDAYKDDANPLARAVEEVLAGRSEAGRIEASLLTRIAGVIKNFARRMGFKLDMSDSEINAILSAAHDRVVNGENESAFVKGLRYMAAKRPADIGLNEKNAEEKIAKSQNPREIAGGVTTLVKASHDPDGFKRVFNARYNTLSKKAIRLVSTALDSNTLVWLVRDRIPALGNIKDKLDAMRSTIFGYTKDINATHREWEYYNRKNPEGGEALANLIHYSRLTQVDTSLHPNAAEYIKNDPWVNSPAVTDKSGRIANIQYAYKLRSEMEAAENSKGAGLDLYKRARDDYARMFDKERQLLLQKINAYVTDPAEKIARTKAVNDFFAETKQPVIYFPLGRFGKYQMRVGSEVQHFESEFNRDLAVEQEKAKQANSKKPKQVTAVDLSDDPLNQGAMTGREGASAAYTNVLKLLESNKASSVDDLKDQLRQLHADNLGSFNPRKRMIHSENRAGFTADAARVYVSHMTSSAYRLARMEHADQVRGAIGSAYASLAGNPDRGKLSIYVDGLARQIAFELAPSSRRNIGGIDWNKWASIGTKATYMWFLSSPKAWLMHPTQLVVYGTPELAKRYGVAATTAMMGKYAKIIFSGRGLGFDRVDRDGQLVRVWDDGPSFAQGQYFAGLKDANLKDALSYSYDVAESRGTLNNTLVRGLMDKSSKSSELYANKGPAMWLPNATKAVFDFMSEGFHQSDRIARQIMLASATELAYKKAIGEGLSHTDARERAAKEANEATLNAMFDYSQFNRPAVLKNPLGRLVGQFQTYTINSTTYMMRNFRDMFKRIAPQDRPGAAKAFLGTMLMSFMFAGTTGSLGYGVGAGMAQAWLDEFYPDRPPEMRDVNLWFRTHFIPEHFGGQGSTLARAIEMGPASALTNMNLQEAASLPGAWLYGGAESKTDRDWLDNTLLDAFGPAVGLARSTAQAFDDFNRGDVARGLETMSPALIKNALKAERYATEGNVNPYSQGVIRDAADFGAGRLLWQAFGGTATDDAQLEKHVMLANNEIKRMENQKKAATEPFVLAYMKYQANPTDAGYEEYVRRLAAIHKYNERNASNPTMQITEESLQSSLNNKLKNKELSTSMHGMSVTTKNAPLAAQLLNENQ